MVAGLLNTRSDAGHELGLLAVALEVEQLGAAIALQGRDEAAQLEASVSKPYSLHVGIGFLRTEQAGTSGSWALARPAATKAIRVVENFILMNWTKK